MAGATCPRAGGNKQLVTHSKCAVRPQESDEVQLASVRGAINKSVCMT